MRSWPGLVLVFAVACGSGTDAPPVDAAVDATLDALSAAECPPCDPDEICVHRFDGVCSSAGPVCVPTALACPEDSCSTECEQALCGAGPYQCQTRPACGSEAPGAFTCYGS